MTFSSLLKDYRTHYKLTKADVAKKLDLSPAYYFYVEAGKRPPPAYDLCLKLVEIFEMNEKQKYDFLRSAFLERASEEDKKFLHALGWFK